MAASTAVEYTNAEILPTLNKGLAAMCRAKPADPRTWLAEWLVANKPPPKQQKEGTAAAQKKIVDMFKSEEGKAELKALWDALDKDGDGTVTSKEWGKGVKDNWKAMGKFFGGTTIGEVGKAFKALDTDGSGDLTWDEFEGAIAAMDSAMILARAMQTEEGLKEFKTLWDSLDKDGDGAVTSKEWGSSVGKNKEVMQKYFGGKDAKAIGKMFKKLDADGSGDLTWEEFVAGSKVLVAL